MHRMFSTNLIAMLAQKRGGGGCGLSKLRLGASTTYFVVLFLGRNGEHRSYPWPHINEKLDFCADCPFIWT